MKNNKGFSLVELIIVIAIMAILVGVMAPQLIKYIEKTNVSADSQLADAVHSAVLTACMDPEVISATDTATAYNALTGGTNACTMTTGDTLSNAILDILGCSAGSEIQSSLKSYGASDVSVLVAGNRCYVWLPGTDATGSKGTGASGTSLSISVY
ncbi:MAG: prepilin-type N-terminal cleavage/methylation domain-containing protein [Lachnospiraceae bacterium]|nr:prepilin-type N-terminal cleavage/methylation domain-containing protein [Lachnospiraceae bacterium]